VKEKTISWFCRFLSSVFYQSWCRQANQQKKRSISFLQIRWNHRDHRRGGLDQLRNLKDPQFVTCPSSPIHWALWIWDWYMMWKSIITTFVLFSPHIIRIVNVLRIVSPLRNKILAMPGIGSVTVEMFGPQHGPPLSCPRKHGCSSLWTGDPVEAPYMWDRQLKLLRMRSLWRKETRPESPGHPWYCLGVVDTLPSNRLIDWRSWRYFKRFEWKK